MWALRVFLECETSNVGDGVEREGLWRDGIVGGGVVGERRDGEGMEEEGLCRCQVVEETGGVV